MNRNATRNDLEVPVLKPSNNFMYLLEILKAGMHYIYMYNKLGRIPT
jgi:hypothetical protein